MEYQRAGFLKRLLAYTLDILLITSIVIAIAWPLGFNEAWSYRTSEINRYGFVLRKKLVRDISFIIYCVYACALEASPLEGTLGKYVLHIKVLKMDGNKLTIKDSIVRNLFKIISMIPLALGFIWALFNKNRSTWHDYIAKTMVVIKKD